jgi:hypothetical protein
MVMSMGRWRQPVLCQDHLKGTALHRWRWPRQGSGLSISERILSNEMKFGYKSYERYERYERVNELLESGQIEIGII